jgi:hypothetical protein
MLRRSRHETVPSRPWTRAERRVVLQGFFGRLSVAVEPLIIGVFFSLLPLGLFLRKQETALLLTPVFGLGALGFFAYAIILMIPCTRALFETFGPIYTVDGYVHYRRRAENGHMSFSAAVLDAHRVVLGEWPLSTWPQAIGERELWPALVEFSPYGGIHRIDGHPTGVLPARISALGIGVAADDRLKR